MVLAGAASATLHRNRLADNHGRPEREAQLALRIERVFPQTHPHVVSAIGEIVKTDPHLKEWFGQRVYASFVIGRGRDPPTRSAVLMAKGVLAAVPRNPPTASFDGYLAGLGVNGRLTRARILNVSLPAGGYYRFCEQLAMRMDLLLGAGLERQPEASAVYRAMMLGRKGDLRPSQKELFLHSGTMHLFAINGLHIGVVALTLHAFLALVRCPRQFASFLVLAVIWLDVDTTGASPSAVRAFILVATLEAAAALRRPGNSLAALATAAVVILLWRPMDFFSASFRMSYGVVAAIFTLGLPLAEWLSARFAAFPDIPPRERSFLQRLRAGLQRRLLSGAGVGLAAGLVSTVTGIEFFGLFTPAGFVANLLLAPPAIFVIAAGFASLATGLAGWLAAARVFNHAAALILRGIDFLIHLTVHIPCACLTAHYRADWIGPAALAALIAACLATYAAGAWRTPRSWWPPFAVVALTLIAGVRYG